MKVNTDHHNTIQNTLATVFKRDYIIILLSFSVQLESRMERKRSVNGKSKIEIAKHYDIPKSTLSGISNKKGKNHTVGKVLNYNSVFYIFATLY